MHLYAQVYMNVVTWVSSGIEPWAEKHQRRPEEHDSQEWLPAFLGTPDLFAA